MVSVLLSALDKRFGFSRMRDSFKYMFSVQFELGLCFGADLPPSSACDRRMLSVLLLRIIRSLNCLM